MGYTDQRWRELADHGGQLMPLRAGKSDKTRNANIRTLMGEVGESPHVQSRAQAIAIAYAKQREAKGKADGGPTDVPVAATPPPDMPAAAPVPYVGDPEPTAPPPPPSQPPPSPPRQAPRQAPPPRQAMPRPQRPPPARQSPRNPADLVRNLKMFYDHYGELRPDQQQRLMQMLGQPLDRPWGMRPEIDWDEFMQHHDLPGAMHERPLYHPPYRGAAYGGRMDGAVRLARQNGGDTPSVTQVETLEDDMGAPSGPTTPSLRDVPSEMPSISWHGLRPGAYWSPPGGVAPPLGPGMEPETRAPQQPSGLSRSLEWEGREPRDPPKIIPPEAPPKPPRYEDVAQGGAIEHAMRIARQAGGANPIALPLMGKPGDAVAPAFQGFIHSHVPGRTDKHELDVAPGSYVVPADVVSAFGEGNLLAGGHLIKFQMGVGSDLTGGIKMPPAGHGMLPMQPHPKLLHMRPMHMRSPGIGHNSRARHADGGEIDNGGNGNVPIIAAGGEVVIPPERLIHKFGSLDRGHQVWDAIVAQEREAEIKRLKTAPEPKK